MDPVVPGMDELESRAWLSLVATMQLLPTALDAQLQSESEMTHFEYSVLTAMRFSQDHSMRLKDLAALTNATPARLSKVVSRLEGRGHLERFPIAGDRRSIGISLTPDGQDALERATPGHVDTIRANVFGRLSRQQLAALADALDPIVAGLDPASHFCSVESPPADPGAPK